MVGGRGSGALKKWLLRGLDIALVATGIWVVWRIVRDYPLHELEAAIFSIPTWALVASAALTAVGYIALVGYDFLALHLVKHPLHLGKVLAPSFISFAVANNAPVAVLTGGGLRYRLYRGLGLPAKKMAKVAAFDVLTFVLGLFTIAGLAFEVAPLAVPRSWNVPLVETVRPIGIVLLITLDVRGYIAGHSASRLPGLSLDQNVGIAWLMVLFWGFIWPWLLISLHKGPLRKLITRLIAEVDTRES